MNKRDKRDEVVSLNEELFSVQTGLVAEQELDERVALAAASTQNKLCPSRGCLGLHDQAGKSERPAA
jgi:hypothetical protein